MVHQKREGYDDTIYVQKYRVTRMLPMHALHCLGAGQVAFQVLR